MAITAMAVAAAVTGKAPNLTQVAAAMAMAAATTMAAAATAMAAMARAAMARAAATEVDSAIGGSLDGAISKSKAHWMAQLVAQWMD